MALNIQLLDSEDSSIGHIWGSRYKSLNALNVSFCQHKRAQNGFPRAHARDAWEPPPTLLDFMGCGNSPLPKPSIYFHKSLDILNSAISDRAESSIIATIMISSIYSA